MISDLDKKRLQAAILEAAFDGIETLDDYPLEAQVHGAICCADALAVLIACIPDAQARAAILSRLVEMLPPAIEHHAARLAAGAPPRKFDS